MVIDAADVAEPRAMPSTLAGATVLQIVPALRESPQARAAIDIARALIQSGSRAIVAGERGELVDELNGFGAEWLALANATLSRSKLKANAEALDKFVAAEGVHIVHAKTTGAAWSALRATGRNFFGLITELPDLSRRRMWLASFHLGPLGRGDRVIVHSMYNARPMIARHRIPVERISLIPRPVDLEYFNPANVPAERVAALQKTWGIPSGVRTVLVPAQIALRNGHLVLVQAARILHRDGMRGVTFVLVGDDRRHRTFVRKFWNAAQAQGVDALFRAVGHQADMPSVYAASDIVVVPTLSEPAYGRVVAEAQSMARPVVASAIGPLPTNMLAPPRSGDDTRTGWEVAPGSPEQLAEGIAAALALDSRSYAALAARARQFSEYMFSPQRAATATLEVYAALLESNK
jgi:glycosyltransferase involved in cell wall biosynthesis